MRIIFTFFQFLCLSGIIFFSTIETVHAGKFVGQDGVLTTHAAACQSRGEYRFGTKPSITTGGVNYDKNYGECYAEFPYKVCCIWDSDLGGYIGTEKLPFLVNYRPEFECPEGEVYSEPLDQCIPIHPNPNRGGEDQCSTDKPVNIATGAKFMRVTDFADSDYPLISINRTYDSADGLWMFNFGVRLFNFDGNKYIQEENGATTAFIPIGDEWAAAIPRGGSLVAAGEQWEYRKESKTYIFDSTGRILKIKNRQGQDITFNYIEDMYQVDVTYPGGTLSVFYDVRQSWIQKVILPDGETIQYHYAEEDSKRLVKVDYAGHITEYRYEHPTLRNLVTSIIDAEGNVYKTIEYYNDGRVRSSSLANGVSSDIFTYNTDDITTVTNPLGKSTTYHFADYFDTKKIVKVQGQASDNCLAANKDYEYYFNGTLKSKTDWKGVKTTYEYNALGLQTLRTEAAGTPQQRQIRTEWHITFRQPTKIIEPDREIHFEYDTDGRLIKRTVKPLQP